MRWLQWLPWRFVVRQVAQAKGFIDPISLLSRIQRFSQPSEVAAPVELLRLASVLHARGLMNAQAIQHNMDWIWPFWVNRQFNPRDPAFIPRAFSLTQINLTHRNWTAVGIPGHPEYSLVDPRGLVTPFYDSWSLEVWLIDENKESLVPSLSEHGVQKLIFEPGWGVQTIAEEKGLRLTVTAWTEIFKKEAPVLRIHCEGRASSKAWLAVSVRPYNPEGVSFVHEIECLKAPAGWRINQKHPVYFSRSWDLHAFSQYHEGDVFRKLPSGEPRRSVSCPVGLATAAALFEIKPGKASEVVIHVPLEHKDLRTAFSDGFAETALLWQRNLEQAAPLKISEPHFEFLYQAALRTAVLHSPKEVYPGPFTYKHFWCRDAALIAYALLCAGLSRRVAGIMDEFLKRQNMTGYFHSQDGEWDSNGQVLWIMEKFCRMTGSPPPAHWKKPIQRAAEWIVKKRTPEKKGVLHGGLFPAGFSAEHLGLNDYYYWDDFWGVQGLRSAAWLLEKYGEREEARKFEEQAADFMRCIENSLQASGTKTWPEAMPASPYRRLDAGSIGSLAAGYPLRLFAEKDPRLLETAEYLARTSFVGGAFFHDIAHAGINPYLSLHIAQIFLRAGDPRYLDIMNAVAKLATRTGQWPEAVHPQTLGGCMGDGQHVWAAAEWILMLRNLFVREEGNKLILASGIPESWLAEGETLSWGPAPTEFGLLTVQIKREAGQTGVSWKGDWYGEAPEIEVRPAGREIEESV